MREVPQLHFIQMVVERRMVCVLCEERAQLLATTGVERLVVPQRIVGIERHQFDHRRIVDSSGDP